MPRVRIGKVEASAPKDTGKPATVASDTTTTEVAIPEGSTLEEVTTSELAEKPLRLTFSRPSALRIVRENQTASTGTVDTSVAIRRADNAARMPLLYAAIGAMVGAAAFLFLKYPTPALLCGAASVVFFVAWQAAGLPAWFWVVGAVAIAGGLALWIGHERGEKAHIP
jgi:hypothetical protein